ncbi:hypothetical protein WSM22_30470 [Cytophagales bacterium WSM2-2]|nr:hypothetical protein WSM22_30470 [Cytophagales bacterium WSM2-2]
MNEFIFKVTKGHLIENISNYIDFEFHALRTFVKQTSDLYDDWEKQTIKTFKENESPEIDGQGNVPYMRRWLKNQLNTRDQIGGIMLSSGFVSSVSLFEYFLKDICDIMIDKSKITPDEIDGESYIEKSKIFLTKVVGVDLSSDEEKWKILFGYSEIRNKIVHNQSRIKKHKGKREKEQPPLYRKIKEMSGVIFDVQTESSAHFIITEPEFIYNYCTLAEEYLSLTIQKVWQRIKALGIEDEEIEG